MLSIARRFVSTVGTTLSATPSGFSAFFKQIVIETSGLADPAPILYTFFTDAFLRQHYRVDNLIVTVDALYIKQQLKQQVVTVK